MQESREIIQQMNNALLALEKNPNDSKYLNDLFRSAHTMKGMAATAGREQIAELCKALEDIFGRLRSRESTLSKAMANSFFRSFDLLQQLAEDENKKAELKQYLDDLQNPRRDEPKEEAPPFQSKSPTIRVKTKDLDSFVDLVGELVITKMRLERSLRVGTSGQAQEDAIVLSNMISELYDMVMNLRLVPVEEIFNRFPRMVRDLAQSMGKSVQLEMGGLEIELDRSILEAIADPLLHMIRNAIDHGIESPEERRAAGKNETGTIRLDASRVGEKAVIVVRDDGRGIDIERIREAAVEKGIASAREAELLSDEAILDLLGTPGLSGAKEVTDLSGRGVGFNVVRSKVESVGGQVRVKTTPGKGTMITMVVPLSLAIFPGLIVRAEGEQYAIPLSSIVTTIQIDRKDVTGAYGRHMIQFREQVVPIIALADILGIAGAKVAIPERNLSIIIVDRGGRLYGLAVDAFERKQEIVLKRMDLPGALTSSYLNATILSDGKVVLILDPVQLLDSRRAA